ncbi:HK97 gp10 family phage protein [Neobacillus sp. NPDC093127]|uniref:HK97 gp10 family phage protein n=1 Tax=Neobacillus sp. NPDC093127 TaxID=3364296 RepID=UPI003813D2AA
MGRYEIEGMKQLEKTIKQLGELPQKVVTKAARQGASVALRAARANAPIDSGDLKKGLKLVGERSKIKGKKVYQVSFDKNKNDIFVKESKEGKRAYYPASQEYGYLDRGGGYVPGFRYLRKSLEDNKRQVEEKTVEVMTKEIDKLK